MLALFEEKCDWG